MTMYSDEKCSALRKQILGRFEKEKAATPEDERVELLRKIGNEMTKASMPGWVAVPYSRESVFDVSISQK